MFRKIPQRKIPAKLPSQIPKTFTDELLQERREKTQTLNFQAYQQRGSGGVQSAAVSQSVRGTRRDEPPSAPFPEKPFKTRDLELPFLRDLSQVVGRTPWDTPVPFYTRTSPWPKVSAHKREQTHADKCEEMQNQRITPPFILSVKHFSVFVLCDLVKTD